MGAGMMAKTGRIRDVVLSMGHILPCPLTLKMRTGLDTDTSQRFAHKLVQRVRLWSLAESEAVKGAGVGLPDGTALVAAITIHGRTRQQRYNKYADWDYVGQVRWRGGGGGWPVVRRCCRDTRGMGGSTCRWCKRRPARP
jgi:tRNA-dihydrouridine synthase 3